MANGGTAAQIRAEISALALAIADGVPDRIARRFAALENFPSADVQSWIDSEPEAYGETLLQVAIDENNADAVRRLIRLGADVNHAARYRLTPLHNAVRVAERKAIVEALLAAGADPNPRNIATGMTPAHIASHVGSIDILQVLLDAGASADAVDDDGATPLHVAAAGDCRLKLDLLLGARAPIDAQDDDGRTPLHEAIRFGRLVNAQRLLMAGALVDRFDEKQRTPLHYAALHGDQSAYELLLRAGAQTKLPDIMGFTPDDIQNACDAIDLDDTEPFPRPDDRSAWQSQHLRLEIYWTVVLQNTPGSDEFLTSSFLKVLHEEGVWRHAACAVLIKSLDGIGRLRRASEMPACVTEPLFRLHSQILAHVRYHVDPNDGFEISEITRDQLQEATDAFDLVFDRLFLDRARDRSVPLSVVDIVKEIGASRFNDS